MTTSSAKRKSVSASGDLYSHRTNPSQGQSYPTTSVTSMTLEIRSDSAVLSAGTRAYFQERLRGRLYDLVIDQVEKYSARGGTRAGLAKRVGKRPEQITRWLSGPGNLTLDTLSDLLLGLAGAELVVALEHPAQQERRARRLPQELLDIRSGLERPSLATTPVKTTIAIESRPTVVSTTVAASPVSHSEVLK